MATEIIQEEVNPPLNYFGEGREAEDLLDKISLTLLTRCTNLPLALSGTFTGAGFGQCEGI